MLKTLETISKDFIQWSLVAFKPEVILHGTEVTEKKCIVKTVKCW